MSYISGPGAGKAPAQGSEGASEQAPVVIQQAPGQAGDMMQLKDSTTPGVLLAHCDVAGIWRGQGFTGLNAPLSQGFTSLVMGADANITPTAAQSQNYTLNVTSSVTLTATRSVILPLVQGATYAAVNLTTGGQSLLFIGASGTGALVSNGARTEIYCDGTNWFRLVEDFTSTGHEVIPGFTPPVATAGASAGTAPPAPVVAATSNDARGSITFGTGTTPAAGAQVVVPYAAAWAITPVCVIVPKNTATQALGLYLTAASTTGFTVACTTAPAASQANTTYAFDYLVLG